MPVSVAAVICSTPNSEFEEVSDPVTATPIQPTTAERKAKNAAGRGERRAQGAGLAGEVHDVGQGEHRDDGEDGQPEVDDDLAERPQRPCRGCTR